MKKYLLLAMVIIIITGCVTKRRCMEKFPPSIVTEDSVTISEKIVYKDSIITLPADSSWLTALLKCDSTGNVYLSQLLNYQSGNKVGVPVIKIRDNIIKVECQVDSLQIYLLLKEKYLTKVHKTTVKQTIHENFWNVKNVLIILLIFVWLFYLAKKEIYK